MSAYSKKDQLSRAPKTTSEKRQQKLNDYHEARSLRESDHFWCERCKVEIAIECHHVAGRDGDLISSYDNLRMLCVPCHRWIHANVQEAKDTGWLQDRNAVKAPGYMKLKAKSVVQQKRNENPKRGH